MYNVPGKHAYKLSRILHEYTCYIYTNAAAVVLLYSIYQIMYYSSNDSR